MIQYLQKVSLFAGLNDDQLKSIEAACTRKTYQPGTVLFHEKDLGAMFYIIIQGSIKIYTSNQSGEEKILTILKAGDSFGELSLIDGKPRSASAKTLETSVLYTLSADDFLRLLKSNFEMTRSIMAELCHRLRDTNQHVHDLTFLDARTRVIKNLILLANRHGKRVGSSITFKMALNYDELARMAGVTKEPLIEVIRDLESKEILKISPTEFTLNLANLRR